MRVAEILYIFISNSYYRKLFKDIKVIILYNCSFFLLQNLIHCIISLQTKYIYWIFQFPLFFLYKKNIYKFIGFQFLWFDHNLNLRTKRNEYISQTNWKFIAIKNKYTYYTTRIYFWENFYIFSRLLLYTCIEKSASSKERILFRKRIRQSKKKKG